MKDGGGTPREGAMKSATAAPGATKYAAACALVAMTAAPAARAVEREHHLGVDLGASTLVVGGSPAKLGPGVGVNWAYGLNDAFNLMIEGAVSIETFGPHPSWVGNAGAGAAYVFDVLQWVPYAGALVGGYEIAGSAIGGPKLLPGVAIAAGLDYRLTRELSIGAAFREHMLVTDTSAYPSFIQVFARLDYTWGW